MEGLLHRLLRSRILGLSSAGNVSSTVIDVIVRVIQRLPNMYLSLVMIGNALGLYEDHDSD